MVKKSNLCKPLISIGIPTFNRPEGLARTLHCLRKQTYGNIEIIVSDNGSNDSRVQEVIQAAAVEDSRIRPYRFARNMGPADNFMKVYREAIGTYFMWAADDDAWEPTFVEELVFLLESDESVAIAFSNFSVHYFDGRPAPIDGQWLESLRTFEEHDLYRRIKSFIAQPPQMGKANLIYGLHRKAILDDIDLARYIYSQTWGVDMLIVGEILSRGRLLVTPDLLYRITYWPPPAHETSYTSRESDRHARLARMHIAKTHLRHYLSYISLLTASSKLNTLEKFKLLLCILKSGVDLVVKDVRA